MQREHVRQSVSVSRTVCRHWPDRVDLLVDALAGAPVEDAPRTTGDLGEDLSHELGRLQGILNDSPFVPELVALIGRAEWDAGVRELKQRLLHQGTAGLRDALEQARARGELAAELGTGEALAQLEGPLFFRRLLADRRIDDSVVAEPVVRLSRARRPARCTRRAAPRWCRRRPCRGRR